jgi:hypothetical protein
MMSTKTAINFLSMHGSLAVVLAAFFTGVIGPLSVLIVQYLINKKEKLNKSDVLDIKKSIKESESIQNHLNQVRKMIQADRLSVKIFHNGGKNVLGKSLEKVSTLYESAAPGIEREMLSFQNIPVAFFSNCFIDMEKNKEIRFEDINKYCDDTEKRNESCGVCPYYSTSRCEFAQVIKQMGVLSAYFYPIFSFDNKFIGFINACYIRNQKVLTEEEKDILQKEAEKLGGFLDHREIPKDKVLSQSDYSV